MQTMDLFTPVVNDEQLHPYFKRLTQQICYKDVLNTIQTWTIGLSNRKKESDKLLKNFRYHLIRLYGNFILIKHFRI